MIAGFRKSLRSWADGRCCCSSLWSRSSSPASAPAASAASAPSAAAAARPATRWPRSRARRSPASEVSDLVNRQFAARAPAAARRSTWPSFLAQGAFEQIAEPADRRRARSSHYADERRARRLATRWSTGRSSTSRQFRNFTGQFDQATFRQVLAQREPHRGAVPRGHRPSAAAAPAARPGRGRGPRAAGRRPRICRTCCSSGGAARSASCRPRPLTAGINPSDAEVAAILPAATGRPSPCPSGG